MRRAAGLLLALALVAGVAEARRPAPPPPPPAPSAGGLIDNANGYALDAQGRVARFTGLLIGKDGRVAKLLGATDARPERLDFRLDAKGRTLLPGLFDAHGQVMALGLRALQLDLAGTTSLAEAQRLLGLYAAGHEHPAWVQGGGWDQERWGLGRLPTAAELDAIVAERPVVLERGDGHALLANSAAMAAAGIGPATRDPPGGRIERDAHGRPSGVFVEAAQDLVRRAVPAPLPRERDAAFLKAQELLLGAGITATCDMGTSEADWNSFRRAGDAGALRERIVAYARGIDVLLAVAGTGPTPWLYGDRLRMVGVALVADGALGSRGAWLKAPYADSPRLRGFELLDDAKLRNLMSRAAMDGFQIAVDATGDAANAQVLDAFEEVGGTYQGDRRWRIEQAQVVDPKDLPRFARLGVVASMQPAHVASDWRMAEARLGPDRLAGAQAWRTMLSTGAGLAFGSDYPVESPDPFAGLAAAIGRADAEGQSRGGWASGQALTITEALAAFTTGTAHAAFAEDRLGGLAVGKAADFVILDRDPIAAPDPATLRATRVEETWIGGVRAWVRAP